MKHQIYLDYNSISLRLDGLVDKVNALNVEGIVILLRGGGFAGIHLAFLTGLPYYFLQYNRENGLAKLVNQTIHGKRVLLVEDFAGSGVTLINAKNYLETLGYEVYTLVVVKDKLSASTPTIACFDFSTVADRIILPWERHRLNKGAVTAKEKNVPDHQYYNTLWFIVNKNNVVGINGDEDDILIHDVLKEKENLEDVLQKVISLEKYTHIVFDDAVLAIRIAGLYPSLSISLVDNGKRVAIQAAGILK